MNQGIVTRFIDIEDQHTVLFGLWPNLSSHPERSSLTQRHIYTFEIQEKASAKSNSVLSDAIGYALADDRRACIDRLDQHSQTLVTSLG